ncbi:hypothetical protein CDD83_10305 [Cordyceps sp. RAO-2017]|nr:hypothetical protein CDD83_10305 [Cordyceps sp. RAO-2017]
MPPASPDRARFRDFILRNADAVWDRDRAGDADHVLFGAAWQGPFFAPATGATQSSALDALVAAVAVA